jgi:serine/threonine protein phosphatase PrpC
MPNCPACASETIPDANFCGRCGAKLHALEAAPAVACRCGAGPEAIDAAGFCEECGIRQSAPEPGEHEEQAIDGDFAAVTDKGRRHAVNEDAIGLARGPSPAGPVSVLVVCDGVSTSTAADRASSAAVAAFKTAALAAVGRGAELAAAAREAADAAQAAVVAIPFPSADNAPAATLVAALARAGRAAIVWAGDSRAYRLAPDPAQLTRDDSWYNEMVESGALTAKQAKSHKFAHAIVRSLGALADSEAFNPTILEIALPRGAALLLCSDGLWNYAEAADDLLEAAPETGSALDICRALVAFANREGGHDNISAALLRG